MKADSVKIADGVYWVGALDWDARDFHGFTVPGMTYNAYLVFGDEKIALIDNVDAGFYGELKARIEDAFAKEGKDVKIDVLVQNHIENDHLGSVPEFLADFPDVDVYCSKKAAENIPLQFPTLDCPEFNVIKTGDTLDLGGKSFTFISANMLHWPDSNFTLYNEGGILFSNDAFGQHLCYAKRMDTDIPEAVLMDAAQKFYGNLITPLSKKVLNKFQEIIDLGLLEQVKMIAPSHGQIWTDPMKIIGAYQDWATGKGAKDKVTIVYDTMHYSTQTMAHEVAEGIISQGYDVEMYFLHEDERSEIVKSILTSKAVAFGIPTINDFPFPSMGDIIYYLKGLHFNRTGFKRPAITFGSMGGRGGSVEFIANELTECGFDVIDQEEIYYVPDDENKERAFELGVKVVEAAKKLEL